MRLRERTGVKARCDGSAPYKLLVSGALSFAIFAELFREQRRELLVKRDQVLSVFPALKLVLNDVYILDQQQGIYAGE